MDATNDPPGGPPGLTPTGGRRHDVRDKRGVFVRRRDPSEGAGVPRLCRVCGQGLLTNSESIIGVHIGCVSDRKYRSKRAPRGPAYGFRKSDR